MIENEHLVELGDLPVPEGVQISNSVQYCSRNKTKVCNTSQNLEVCYYQRSPYTSINLIHRSASSTFNELSEHRDHLRLLVWGRFRFNQDPLRSRHQPYGYLEHKHSILPSCAYAIPPSLSPEHLIYAIIGSTLLAARIARLS